MGRLVRSHVETPHAWRRNGLERADAAPAPPHPYRWAMLAGVWWIYYAFGLTVASMAPLVGPIGRDLGLSHAAMGGIFGAWPLVYIVSAIPCGAVLDRVGLRWSLFAGAAIVGASGLLRVLATDHLGLFLAVAVFGLGGPIVSVGAPKLIGLWFDGQERSLAMGIYVTGPALGNVTALALTNSVMMPLAGGSWRRVLLAYALLALATGAAWLALSARRASRQLEARLAAEPSPAPLQVFAGLVRHRSVQLLLLMSVGIFFVNHGLGNWLPEVLRSRGLSPVAADFWASMPIAVGIAAALVLPRLAVASRRPAVLGGLFACAGAATLAIGHAAGPWLAVGLVLQGIARGSMLTFSMLILMETREVGLRHLGAAAGLFFSAAEIGGALGPLAIGSLHDLTGDFAAGLGLLTAVCAALMVLLGAFTRVTARAPRGARG
jgi:cyanate permease